MSSDPQNREDQLQAAFDDAADELGLTLEARPEPESKCAVGMALVVAKEVESIAQFEPDKSGGTLNGDDDQEIRRVITAWEAAEPEELAEVWSGLAIEPFVAFGANYTAKVTKEHVARALASEAFKSQLKEYPLQKPRKIEVSDFNIVYLGQIKAVVTYRAAETYTTGQTFAGNAAVMMVKDATGWKIAVFAKHDRFIDFLPVGDDYS